jgi:uncharacterized repeat protein (TIGR01451 family)
MRLYLGALVIAIWLTSIPLAAAFTPSDIEWSPAVTGTLYKGGTLSNGDYKVKAVEFPGGVQGVKDIKGNWVPETDVDPMVYLEVYKNGSLIKEIIVTPQSEPYIDPDYEVKVYGTRFMSKSAKEWVLQYYNPWATVAIETRAKPKLEVTVKTDKTAYTSYNDLIITATVTIKNSGGAVAKNVDVNLNTGDLKLRGGSSDQLHQYYYTLQKGASQSFSVILVVPQLIDQKSYNLSADSKGYDVKDLEYKAKTGSASLIVSPRQNYFTISKSVKDNIYLKDTAFVKITVANGGMYDISNININDSMNGNFKLISDATFKWYIPLLKPGEEWSTSYSIQPLDASLSGFTIPAATAQFTVNNKPYIASSKTTTVVVNGPKITVNKTVNKATVNITEDVIVTIKVNNVGNIATNAQVKDSLPDGVSLVSGYIAQSNFTEPNKPWGFSYIIRMDTDGNITLPAATATYTDVQWRGIERAVISSETPVVTVIDPSKVPPPLPTVATPAGTAVKQTNQAQPLENAAEITPTPITPGFNITIAISILIIAAVFRRR